MADLRNDSGALRFAVELVAQVPARPLLALEATDAANGQLLASAGLEYLDRRDGEWWPLVRLPALRFPLGSVERLVSGMADLVRGSSPGLAWRPEDDAAVGLQLGAAPGGAVVEVGLDLGLFLAEAAGEPRRPGTELALFRFRAAQADLVCFSDALARELEALRT